MKRIMYLLSAVFFFTGCGRLDKLTWDMTPEKWLSTHSFIKIKSAASDFVIAEPSSTIIVYGLGFIILAAGVYFLKNRGESRSRLLWGIALLFWSASTFSAGTSYQAFSYELKCAGRSICLWTTWWEIWYLILFVISMNLITAAVSFSSAAGKLRKGIIIYSAVNTSLYLGVVLSGALIPHQFMASFECMVLFTIPSFLILFTINTMRYIKIRKSLDILLVGAWIFMFLVVFVYFAFFLSGYADVLWKRGIWFNANDVLHIGLILWIIYLLSAVAKRVEDTE